MKKCNIDLNIDISYKTYIQGDPKAIAIGNDTDYVSIIDMFLPAKYLQITAGTFSIEYNDFVVDVEIKRINTKEEDPLLEHAKRLKEIGAKIDVRNFVHNVLNLPMEAITDNRGKYPAVMATLTFPKRIVTWIDVEHDSGIRGESDYEVFQVTGGSDSKEKILALIILNRLIKSLQMDGLHPLSYDDVTMFFERYFKIPDYTTPLILSINTLASKDAYKNAVYDYLLPKLKKSELIKSADILQKEYAGKELINANDLKSTILNAIENVLKYNIELRRWIEPFWDGERTINDNGTKKTIPRMPKYETKIQPTLHVILDMVLLPLGIHVTRESDEGIGRLEFKFLFTTKSGVPLTVGVEFKLAHHGDIEHGITKQLPAYLKVIRSTTGIFVVMWFKDPEFFNKPVKYNKEEMDKFLLKQAKSICSSSGMDISSVMIDASTRSSASNL